MAGSRFEYVGLHRQEPSPGAQFDIVFVHGVTGDLHGTWTHANSGFWPKWIAQDFEDLNVYSAGYESSLMGGLRKGAGASLQDLSTILLDRVANRPSGDHPLVFITHSLGGLIVKQMLRKAQDASNERRRRIASLTEAVVFIATPHAGAHLAKSVNAALRIAASKSLRELEYSADALVDLGQWFSPWAAKNGLKVEAYYEVEKYAGVLIVDQVTANPNVLGCDPVAIQADHVAITKLPDRDAQLYQSIRGFLLSLLRGDRRQGDSPVGGAIASGSSPRENGAPIDHRSSSGVGTEAGQRHVAGEGPQQAPAKALRRSRFEAFGYDRNFGSSLEYALYRDGRPMTFSDVLDRWESDVEFVDFYIELFRQSGFYAFIWETPPVSSECLDGDFRFIVHNLPRSSGRADRETYAEYFDIDDAPEGVVSFLNLGHDALLVVPSPFRRDADYSGMAEFLTSAPVNQQRMLWSELGRLAKRRLSQRPMWISVAGGGIRWLHIRLDSEAKYYRYGPYASPGYWAGTGMAQ